MGGKAVLLLCQVHLWSLISAVPCQTTIPALSGTPHYPGMVFIVRYSSALQDEQVVTSILTALSWDTALMTTALMRGHECM